MTLLSRRALLAASAGVLAAPVSTQIANAQTVKPRLTAISQWSAGSDGAAITALGKKFEEHGGLWQHSPVPGFTTEMMNKLRAQILAGDPPACSQLKGPEIEAWSKIAPTVNLDAIVAAAGYEKVVAPDLARIPEGCAFAPRCKQATDACRQASPPLRDIDHRHQVACILEV